MRNGAALNTGVFTPAKECGMRHQRVQSKRKWRLPWAPGRGASVGLIMMWMMAGGVLCSTGGAEQAAKRGPQAFLEGRIEHLRKAIEKHPDAFRHRFQLARHLHLKGAAGDREAAKEALQRFQTLHNAQPDDRIVTAYLGGAVMLSAKRQFFPWDKKDKLEQARDLLNAAVEQAADPYEPRLLRGIATSFLPASLGQAKHAWADLQWAVEHAKQRLDRGAIEPADAAAAHFHFGRMMMKADKADRAKAHWQKAVKLAPDSYAGLQAQVELSQDQ
jgi:tetratricopeptide (TPR) repeat protein